MKSIIVFTLCALFGICTMAQAQSPEMKKRIEFRKELNNPAMREAAIRTGLLDADPVIRKKALYELYAEKGVGAAEKLKQMAGDPDKGIQLLLIACVKDITNLELRSELATYISEHAVSDELKRDARRRSVSPVPWLPLRRPTSIPGRSVRSNMPRNPGWSIIWD